MNHENLLVCLLGIEKDLQRLDDLTLQEAQELVEQALHTIRGVLRRFRTEPNFPNMELPGNWAKAAEAAALFGHRVFVVCEVHQSGPCGVEPLHA